MKRLYTIIAVTILTASYASAQIVTERCWHLDKVQFLQHKQDFWRSHTLYSTSARPYSAISGGYYNLTELQYGFGLKKIDRPYSRYYAGITTVNGWRFGSGIALGFGIGYHQYNEGYGIPLYGDLRFFMGKQRVKFFLMGSGGLIMNFNDFQNESKIFANPGAGILVPVAKSTQLSFSAGFFSQFDGTYITEEGDGYRDSFINMKLGLLFGK